MDTFSPVSPLAERFFVSLVFAWIGALLSGVVFVISMFQGVVGLYLLFALVASIPVALVNAFLGSAVWRGTRMVESWLLAGLVAGFAAFLVAPVRAPFVGFMVIEMVGLGSLVVFSRLLPPRRGKLQPEDSPA